MARRSDKHQQEILTYGDQQVYDDLDSVTRDLPAPPPPEEDSASESPAESLKKMSEAADAREKRRHPLRRLPSEDGTDDREPKDEEKRVRRQVPKTLRTAMMIVISGAFLGVIAMTLFSGMYPNVSILTLPERAVSQVVTPVQSFFSNISESFFSYMRTVKLRSNLETAYNNLRAENEKLVYQAMLAEELQVKLSQYQNMYDEIAANGAMNPIGATVIGRSDNRYFSTFTINRGSKDGLKDYMAVTISGALVGYTENVTETKADVRAIIDAEASIAGLIQSSRDQGTIRGTLGVDGRPMCRMYYLPEDHLPRPGDTVVTSGVGMSFPKGIPIGTVRESTRGMEANKQYIVVEPIVDFEHIEYVIVLRYQPSAVAVSGRSNELYNNYVPLETARPMPTLRIGSSTSFLDTGVGNLPTIDPTAVTPSPAPQATLTPTFAPLETPVPTTEDGAVYVPVGITTPTPSPTPPPTPTPYVTLSPDDMTYEDD